ncbi:PcfJ-like protein [Siphonobacter sp. BAB-5405]|uniref:PcfJ domain-containing protein n=1 Tax=Siphonobacter sp. BAB-5405 TaxID=1864825 RepID=UPI000C7FA4E2|nr:PcfJ domain-containing protein [Siphonobacter sp. BAB-5405]PMD94862.1 PcfJ-like protein [Siphonobacter sp. BAB-5405]
MKPKTKLEKRVVSLINKIKPITPAQKAWGIANCLEKRALVTKHKVNCLECGNTWIVANTAECSNFVCSKCSCSLNKVETRLHRDFQAAYYAILTTVEDLQVVRMFYVRKWGKVGKPAESHVMEVMQHWITPEGKFCLISCPTNPMNGYIDSWTAGGHLRLTTTASRNATLRSAIHADKVYPRQRVIPSLKRNGFTGDFYGISPVNFFCGLLRDSEVETLLKAGQTGLLQYIFQWNAPDKILSGMGLWPSVKICIRNHYIVSDGTLWVDYIKMLRDFQKDLLNSHFVCPVDLVVSHDKLVDKKREHQRQLTLTQQRKKAVNHREAYVKAKAKFFGLEFSNGDITVKVLESVDEFITEGDVLRHCVFSSGYYQNENSLILSARIDGKPVETVEISLNNLKIIQSRGFKNKPSEYHDQVVSLVNQNLPAIGKVLHSSEGGGR